MTTIIEKDSSGPAVVLMFVILLIVVCGGLGLAYSSGVFGEKTTIIENNKTVENKTVIVPAPAAPAREPRPEDHAPEHAPAH